MEYVGFLSLLSPPSPPSPPSPLSSLPSCPSSPLPSPPLPSLPSDRLQDLYIISLCFLSGYDHPTLAYVAEVRFGQQ